MSVLVSTSIDEATKQQFDKVCEAIGISPANVLGMLIRGVVNDNGIPSSVVTSPEQYTKMSREEMFDCARGQFNIPDDFDAPLELRESAEPVNRAFQIGCMKGKIWMSDDFDAPMEEFEEYM